MPVDALVVASSVKVDESRHDWRLPLVSHRVSASGPSDRGASVCDEDGVEQRLALRFNAGVRSHGSGQRGDRTGEPVDKKVFAVDLDQLLGKFSGYGLRITSLPSPWSESAVSQTMLHGLVSDLVPALPVQ